MENNLASLLATGIRCDTFLEFVLFVSRPDTLSEFDPPPPFYYVFVIRHFAFFLVPTPLQELNNYNSLLRYFLLALINKSVILLGQNLFQQQLVWFQFLAVL